MTTLDGAGTLFVVSFCLFACLGISLGQIGILALLRSVGGARSHVQRIATGSSFVGIAASAGSWLVAVVLIGPRTVASGLLALDQLVVVLSVGYALPAVLGVLLWPRAVGRPSPELP